MDELLAQLNHATNQKQTIINNGISGIASVKKIVRFFGMEFRVSNTSSPYVYKETIASKHKTSFLGINAEPYYTYHDETRFNHAQYNSDLSSATLLVNAKTIAVESALVEIEKEVKAELRINIREDSLLTAEVRSLQQQINTHKVDSDNLSKINYSLSVSVENENSELTQTKSKISQSESYTVSLKSQISAGEGLQEENQQKIQKLKEIVADTGEMEHAIEEMAIETEKVLISIETGKRSELLMKLWNQKDDNSICIVKLIIKLGFDGNYQNLQAKSLMGMALDNGDMKLFDLVMDHNTDINLELPTINGQTLLQYSIANNYEDFTVKMLKTDTVFSRTLMCSVRDNDTATIDKLFLFHPELTEKLYHGHTLLQLAVISCKPNIIERVIKINKDILNDLNFKDESAFIIALKMGNEGVINKLLEYVDIDAEIDNLLENSEIDLLSALFEVAPEFIDSLDEDLLYKLICDKKFDLAVMLVDYGSDLDFALEMVISKNNKEAFVDINKNFPDYILEESRIDKKSLVEKATLFGDELLVSQLEDLMSNMLGNVNVDNDDSSFVSNMGDTDNSYGSNTTHQM